jgi:hypothetical protein
MGKFALQKGPCNFLKLRISPWGNPFLLLSLFFFYLAFSFIHWRHLPLVPVLIPSLSLSSAGPSKQQGEPKARQARERLGPSGGRRWGSARAGAAPGGAAQEARGRSGGARRKH